MTDPTPPNAWTTHHTGPGAAAGCLSSASETRTSNKSVGDVANFKLTKWERNRIDDAVYAYLKGNITSIPKLINIIEAIINEGWQTCTCTLDTDV